LEEIVVQIAGISGEDMPGSRLKKHLLCITDKNDAADEYENDDYDEDDESINAFLDVETTAEKYNTKLTFAVIKEDAETTEAFDFGRMVGEDLSFKTPIIGIAILNDLSLGEDIGDELGENLLTEDGKLKYDASEFLKYVPKERRCLVSGVIGAIISAAHNSSLLIVDTGAVDIIARYIEKLCPEVQPYILHASKLFIPDEEGLDDELDGEAACAAMEIVIAALYATNKMKSFNETEVNTAIDGIGASRQG